MTRPTWDEYFAGLLPGVASRGTCDRKRVGAILVDPSDHGIITTGYNGAAPDEPHCDDVGHDLVERADGTKNCVRTVHAEENAILRAARRGIAVEGAELYTNTYPCWDCAQMIISVCISRVIYDADYNNDERVAVAFARRGIPVVRVM